MLYLPRFRFFCSFVATLCSSMACIAQQQVLSEDSVLKLYQQSTIGKYYLSINYYNLQDLGLPDSGYSEIEINRFVSDTFDFIYQGDFNGNGKEDLLTALTPQLGCGYQFFLFDYATNNIAKQVVKLNPACPYYCYLVPKNVPYEFTYYYIKKKLKEEVLDSVDIVMYKGELLEKSLLKQKPAKVKTFSVELKLGQNSIAYHYKKKKLKSYFIKSDTSEEVGINKDTAVFITEIMSKINFQQIEKRNTSFDDAPSLTIALEYKNGESVKFTDSINFFTGGSLYYSVNLATLYKLFYPYLFKEEYW